MPCISIFGGVSRLSLKARRGPRPRYEGKTAAQKVASQAESCGFRTGPPLKLDPAYQILTTT